MPRHRHVVFMLALLACAAFCGGCAHRLTVGDVPPPLLFIGNSLTGKLKKPRPIHGNWCGPAYPDEAGKARLAPLCADDPRNEACTVDDLDFACRTHDLCIERYGPACACDQWFVDYLLQGRSMSDPSVRSEYGGQLYKSVQVVRAKRCLGGCKNIQGVATCEKR